MPTFKGKIQIFILSNLVKLMFEMTTRLTLFKNSNYPKEKPCIYALWHAHQCALYANKEKSKLHVLISPSNDGEIIARGVHHVGINTVRGSKGRQGVSSTMQLLEKLENGDSIAITVDGPKGPKRVVKDGIINIAKMSQIPIIPVLWYSPSPNFLKFKSWDEFRYPIGLCKTVALYGDPIYVPSDADKETIEKYRLLLENKMQDIYKDLKANFKKYLKQKDL
ncbi:MAG: lysophospholipid acyltransferase family protein [Candidatus Gastranaerophilales bacterium]|nr:lysophospholipid acyltransferase family protein [Candidatus Gastranaerophilales bacterium]